MINMPYFYLTSDFMGCFDKLVESKNVPFGAVDKKTAEMIFNENEDKMFIDYRLPALSVSKSDNIDGFIYNYSMFFAAVMANNPVIRLYIEFGLVPLAFYPTTHSEFINKAEEKLEDIGLKYFKRQAMFNHSRKDVHKEMYDSWVSRIDAAEFMDCPPEEVKMSGLYRKVMEYEPS